MKKIILLSLAFVLIIAGCNVNKEAEKGIGPEEVQAKGEKFINENLMPPGSEATVLEVVEDKGLYKLKVKLPATQGNQEVDSYMTKDGNIFFPQGIDMAEVEKEKQASQTEQDAPEANIPSDPASQPSASSYSEGEKSEIDEFVSCLATKNFKIYGANWCGWTKKLVVDTFGGFDVVEPIYVECTEETELCSSEGVKGYPTIKLGGEPYSGQRTFVDMANKTGCAAPNVQVVESSNSDSAEGGCGS